MILIGTIGYQPHTHDIDVYSFHDRSNKYGRSHDTYLNLFVAIVSHVYILILPSYPINGFVTMYVETFKSGPQSRSKIELTIETVKLLKEEEERARSKCKVLKVHIYPIN